VQEEIGGIDVFIARLAFPLNASSPGREGATKRALSLPMSAAKARAAASSARLQNDSQRFSFLARRAGPCTCCGTLPIS